MSLRDRIRDRIHRALAYFSVLRPSFIFGALIIYLPLTAFSNHIPGSAMLGNLFVEYGFWKAFWFGFALFGAVWALMLTTCLSLDLARERQTNTAERWLPDPGEGQRWVTIPMRDQRTFVLFTLIAAPGAVAVLWRAGGIANAVLSFIGLIVGCCLAFLGMSFVAGLMNSENKKYQVFPWRPFDLNIKWFGKVSRPFLSWIMKKLLAPEEIFAADGKLRDDHFFAALSTVAVVFIYTVIYGFFHPKFIAFPLENIPPAAFIYALLLPLIWVITALWVYLSRYRLVFLALIASTLILTRLATVHTLEATIGGPSHTYDVVARQTALPRQEKSVAAPAASNGTNRKLIVVATSGGGILAAGWTAHVLTQLDMGYTNFRSELGLISSVSGGSVGAAHYFNALGLINALTDTKQRHNALTAVANDAMRSSLASSAYGVAFADFRRIVFPFFADETFDRAHLLEADWRRIGNCRRGAIAHQIADDKFQDYCERQKVAAIETRTWMAQINPNNDKPVAIFNSTVMETGERIAITPLRTLQSKWNGSLTVEGEPVPPRHAHARTLSEFLEPTKLAKPADPSKQDKGKQKIDTCDSKTFTNGYDIDLWTAARLSATFSYVSPAARAACLDTQHQSRQAAADDSNGRLHLIDGGYHDNFGVASALDWLAAQQDPQGDWPFSQIAIIEIRAKPDIPTADERTEWSSAWLGPFWGLFNSWGFAQTSANDTAVNQVIARFRDKLRERKICIESFVFVPEWTGPLSWHLSEEQKTKLRDEWGSPANRSMLKAFKSFMSDDKLPANNCQIAKAA